MKNIIFIAPPAAGKGTQSTMLKENYGYNHLSTGDMLREVVSSGTEFGLQVKNIIDRGELVSDDIMIDLIKDKLSSESGKPFILDGFPRTLNQAKSLDNMLDDDYVVIYLDLGEEEATNRIVNRLTCKCGKSYNLNVANLKPKVEGICDGCGKELVKRNDDNVDSFKVRYKTFLDNTKPLMEYYEDKNKLHKINVNRNVEDIFKDIMDVCND
mgnify:CR=1 FL=1